MKTLVLGLVGLLMACDSQPATQTIDPNAFQTVTNTSMCTGAAPANLTIIGSWQQSMQNGAGEVVNSVITIAPNSTTITADCTFPGGLVIPVTMAPSPTELTTTSSGTNEYIIPSNYAATQTAVDSTGALQTCPVSLSENTAIVTSAGPCMILTYADGSTETLVPLSTN